MSPVLIELVAYVVVLLLAAKPLGLFMARVLEGHRTWLSPVLGPLERLCYRLTGVNPSAEMGWKRYAGAVLFFNFAGLLVVYALQRLQHLLPLNPQHLAAVTPDSAFNTAVSFATNTNWQGYAGETTMSYLTQMLGLGVQNFVSAASGIAVLAAFVRGFARHSSATIGNFWADLVRTTLYILLPLSFVLALALVSQGVVQTFAPYVTAHVVEPVAGPDGKPITDQILALGPAASQIAIKQLGTNGGGFFNANSAHPFENSTPLSCFLELLAILLISGALCYSFGRMVRDTRQGWAVLAAMTAVMVACLVIAQWSEQAGNPRLTPLGADQVASLTQPGGNMEGKEARFGIGLSSLWAVTTTCASNGSVNSMHDSFTPLGGMIPMWLIQLGEVIYGGVGSGLYGMLAFAIIAVFVAGLMVGRTPEYIGKKIQSYEMKMASLMVLLPPAVVLVGTAISVVAPAGLKTIFNPGIHGFSEVLYAFSSSANNNGSAFAGLNANTPWYNGMLGIAMFVGRFWLKIPALAIAGSLAAKKSVPAGAGTLPTHTPLFVVLLIGTVLVVGALTFFPALALGPIVEHLVMVGGRP
ncbi:MAG TPA: potassium-transporting ATPase subunit KdpA [Candidatus Sulfotelmatobacter sp.]|nr:potassium-transporting ATPase subunit KdpA [Candidatus Sulfotelmatobacter sp.]